MTGAGTWNPMRQQYDQPLSLADFLLARIAEDEAWTRANLNVHRLGNNPPGSGPRLLAECEAKRRIVEQPWPMTVRTLDRAGLEDGTRASDTARLHVLRLLALPYADHPDYRDEWRT